MAAATSVMLGLGTISTIGGAIATGIGAKRAEEAQREANRIAEEANAIARQKLAFAQQVYTDWQDTYGPINNQLAEYYATLSADGLASYYKDAGDAATTTVLRNVDAAKRQLQQTFNKQGMANSGAAAAAEMQLATNAIGQKAAIDYDTNLKTHLAGMQVMDQKKAYYGMGLSEKGQALSLVNDAYNTNINALGYKMQANNMAMNNAQDLLNSGVSMIGSGMGYFADAALLNAPQVKKTMTSSSRSEVYPRTPSGSIQLPTAGANTPLAGTGFSALGSSSIGGMDLNLPYDNSSILSRTLKLTSLLGKGL